MYSVIKFLHLWVVMHQIVRWALLNKVKDAQELGRESRNRGILAFWGGGEGLWGEGPLPAKGVGRVVDIEGKLLR